MWWHTRRNQIRSSSETDESIYIGGGSNTGWTMFRIKLKTAGYPLHSPLSPSLLLPCVAVCHQIPFPLYFAINTAILIPSTLTSVLSPRGLRDTGQWTFLFLNSFLSGRIHSTILFMPHSLRITKNPFKRMCVTCRSILSRSEEISEARVSLQMTHMWKKDERFQETKIRPESQCTGSRSKSNECSKRIKRLDNVIEAKRF